MSVICLNCEGWGCLQCKNDREAAKGGEQGLNPLELHVQHLRRERDEAQQLVVEQRELLLVLKTQRDALLAEIALLRVPGGAA